MTRIHFLLSGALLLLLCQCSAKFNVEWKRSSEEFAQHKPADITGPWTGYWKSDANGHSGDLRCIVSPTQAKAPSKPGFGEPCRFRYNATFIKILSATYDVKHPVLRTKDGFTFIGDQALFGKGSGLYHYEGRATPTEFHASYRSESDYGMFEMKRP